MEKKTSSNDFTITRRGLLALTGTALAGSLLGHRSALASEDNQISPMDVHPNDALNDSVLPDPTTSERKNVRMKPLSHEEQEESARVAGELERALLELGIEAEVEGWDEGPTCTTYHTVLAPGTNLYDIAELNWDIKSQLECKSAIFHASTFDINRADIEISRTERRVVNFGDLLPYLDGGPLDMAIGVDSYWTPVHVDLAELPHILVSGAVGSGKSTLVHAMISSLIIRNTPEDVRLILIDPKQIEFEVYNGIPHLVTPVVNNMSQAVALLQWSAAEMDRRHRLFSSLGARDLKDYNTLVDSDGINNGEAPLCHLPSVVIVIDELSDVIVNGAENLLMRIAQLGRTSGIHLIIAAGYMSYINSAIRTDIPVHAAQRLCKSSESHLIVRDAGAEQLLPHGDMLFLNPNQSDRAQRIQSCFISKFEIAQIAKRLQTQPAGEPWQDMSPLPIVRLRCPESNTTISPALSQIIKMAARLVVQNQSCSLRMLKEELELGSDTAHRVMNELEKLRIVGPAQDLQLDHSQRPHDVLIQSLDELEEVLHQRGVTIHGRIDPPLRFEGPYLYTISNGAASIVDYMEYQDINHNIPSNIPSSLEGFPLVAIQPEAFVMYRHKTHIIIPNSVVSIGERAFAHSDIKSLYIPASVLNIGEGAFTWNYRLESIEVDPANPVFCVIDHSLIRCLRKQELLCFASNEPNVAYTIPRGITHIGCHSFVMRRNLSSIDFGTDVRHIGEGAFWGCRSLFSVQLSDGLQDIGDRAFSGCISLAHIEIPESVHSIGKDVFLNCSPDFTLTVTEGSYAERWAKENGVPYTLRGQRL